MRTTTCASAAGADEQALSGRTAAAVSAVARRAFASCTPTASTPVRGARGADAVSRGSGDATRAGEPLAGLLLLVGGGQAGARLAVRGPRGAGPVAEEGGVHGVRVPAGGECDDVV